MSEKYILITVPNEEDLEHFLVRCPECYCWFNPSFHVRNFNKEKLNNLFNNFRLVKLKEIGPTSKRCPSSLVTLYRVYKKPNPPNNSICPQCGYRYKEEENRKNIYDNKITKKIIKKLAKIICFPKTFWLLALYQKK